MCQYYFTISVCRFQDDEDKPHAQCCNTMLIIIARLTHIANISGLECLTARLVAAAPVPVVSAADFPTADDSCEQLAPTRARALGQLSSKRSVCRVGPGEYIVET